MRIAISARAALPLCSLQELRGCGCDIEVYQLMGLGNHPLYGTDVIVRTLFVDASARDADNVTYIPCCYGNAENVFDAVQPARAILACAMQGDRLSWGVSWDVSGYLYDSVEDVVLEVNRQMPFTGRGVPYRKGTINHVDYPLPVYDTRADKVSPVLDKVASRVAGLIPDGATIQVGVGSLPELVCRHLASQNKRVGVWTEAFGNPLMDLCERGLVDGKPTCSFLWGSTRLYEWSATAGLNMQPLSIVNKGVGLESPLYSILGALEVDIHGNVNAEVLGGQQFSGTGGYSDFVNLAWTSGGRSIIALPSVTSRGKNRIVSHVEHTTLPRSLSDIVVTERGVSHLRGLTLDDRRDVLSQLYLG